MITFLVDICFNNPCLNGGTCRQYSDTAAYCMCHQAYSGAICEYVSKCINNPCQNGGNCSVKLTEPYYKCTWYLFINSNVKL